MTSLKDRLIALNDEAQSLKDDVRGLNSDHANNMNQLNTIETFLKDNKKAIEDEAKENAGVETVYNNLKNTLTELKAEIQTLKTQNNQLKNKIAGIAGLCVFSGTVLGLISGLSLNFLKGVIDKHKRVS